MLVLVPAVAAIGAGAWIGWRRVNQPIMRAVIAGVVAVVMMLTLRSIWAGAPLMIDRISSLVICGKMRLCARFIGVFLSHEISTASSRWNWVS